MGLFDKLKRDKGYRTLGVDVGLPKKAPEPKKTLADKVPHIIDLTPVGRATSKVGKVLSIGAKSIIDKGSKWAKEKSIAQQQHGADYGLEFGIGSDPYGLGMMGGSGESSNNDPYGLGITGMNVGQTKPRAPIQKVHHKKSQKHPVKTHIQNPRYTNPKIQQKQKSNEQRSIRERKIYDALIKKGVSPTYAIMQSQKDRYKR